MRYALIVAAVLIYGSTTFAPALAQECTGQNCPQPQGGGHECESKKKEQTTS